MDNPDIYKFNQQAPAVTGFLGGITFTAMVLLIQLKNDTIFSELLISATAFVSFLFIIATLGSLYDPLLHKGVGKKHFKIIATFLKIGFYGLLALIPLIILSFSLAGSIVVGILEVICFIIFSKNSEWISIKKDKEKDSV